MAVRRYMMVKRGTKQKLTLPHLACAQRTWIVSAKGVITGRFQTFIGFSYELPHTICTGFSAKHILKYSFLACWPLNTFFKGRGSVDMVILLLWRHQISNLPWLHILIEFPVCSYSQTATGTTPTWASFPTKTVGVFVRPQHKIWISFLGKQTQHAASSLLVSPSLGWPLWHPQVSHTYLTSVRRNLLPPHPMLGWEIVGPQQIFGVPAPTQIMQHDGDV